MGSSSWTKFGFNYETKEAERALKEISKKKTLNLRQFTTIQAHLMWTQKYTQNLRGL